MIINTETGPVYLDANVVFICVYVLLRFSVFSSLSDSLHRKKLSDSESFHVEFISSPSAIVESVDRRL